MTGGNAFAFAINSIDSSLESYCAYPATRAVSQCQKYVVTVRTVVRIFTKPYLLVHSFMKSETEPFFISTSVTPLDFHTLHAARGWC